MKSMKLFVGVIALIFFFTSSAMAQESLLTAEQKAKFKEHIKESFEKLDLSEKQQPKFKEITKKYVLQVKTLRTSDYSKTTKIKEFKLLIDAKNKEMKALLSAKQYKVYEEKQNERLKKLKRFEQLNLSEKQQPKFKEITKKYVLQRKTLKNSDKAKLAKLKEFKSLIDAKNKEMKALLSAEQYKIYEIIQKERIKKLKENRK